MLWNLFKSLKRLAPIYREELKDDLPDKYVILRDSDFDEGYANGDGQQLIRQRSFSVVFHIRSTKASSLDSLLDAYRDILREQRISFSQIGPFYEPTTGFMTASITGSYVYLDSA